VTSLPDTAERVTVNVEFAAFSLPAVTSAILKLGVASSSVIVNVAVESLIVAFDALDKVIVAVSLFSSRVSARTGTLKVPVVAPAEIVKVPDVAV